MPLQGLNLNAAMVMRQRQAYCQPHLLIGVFLVAHASIFSRVHSTDDQAFSNQDTSACTIDIMT